MPVLCNKILQISHANNKCKGTAARALRVSQQLLESRAFVKPFLWETLAKNEQAETIDSVDVGDFILQANYANTTMEVA